MIYKILFHKGRFPEGGEFTSRNSVEIDPVGHCGGVKDCCINARVKFHTGNLSHFNKIVFIVFR